MCIRDSLNEARGALCDADDEPALLDAIVRCACILFDFGQANVFLRESATGMLRARETEGLLRELVIDPDGAANAVARAFKERRAHHSPVSYTHLDVYKRQPSP